MKKSVFIFIIIVLASTSCFAQNKFQHPDGKYVKVIKSNTIKFFTATIENPHSLFLIRRDRSE